MKFIIRWYGRRVEVAMVDRNQGRFTVRLPSGRLITIFQEDVIKVKRSTQRGTNHAKGI